MTYMELALAITALLFGMGLTGSMVWLQNRPKKQFKVSLVPHTPLMFLGAVIAILAVAYLLTLNGIDLPARTGRF